LLKKLSFYVRNYFGFSRTETRGLFFLLTVSSLALAFAWYVEYAHYQHYSPQTSDLRILVSLMQVLEKNEQKKVNTLPVRAETVIQRFPFDPNQSSPATLMALGINQRLTQTIVNYRNKGGKFYKKEDLLKIFGFPEKLYQELEPYIAIREQHRSGRQSKDAVQTSPLVLKQDSAQTFKMYSLDINQADSLQLQQLNGIGPVLSSRIVKYRDRLGGFHEHEQLEEIYHISEEALNALRAHTFVGEQYEPRQLNINTADFKTLLAHPYLSYEQVKGIVNHRKIYGNFTSLDQLREVPQLQEVSWDKLLPYLAIE